MKNVTKIVLAAVAAVTTMLQVPAVHNLVIAAIAAHPDVAALAGGLSTVLALLHDPNPQIAQISQTGQKPVAQGPQSGPAAIPAKSAPSVDTENLPNP